MLLRHGGIAWRYDLFCEPELSARLHVAGCAIGYAPAAAIYHAGMDTVAEIRAALEDYGRGECRYRLEHPRGELDKYLGTPGWWSERGLFDAAIERQLWLSCTKYPTGGSLVYRCSGSASRRAGSASDRLRSRPRGRAADPSR